MRLSYKSFLIICFISTCVLFADENIRNKFALGLSFEETSLPSFRTKFKIYKPIFLEVRLGSVFEEKQYSNYSGLELIGIRGYFYILNLKTKYLFVYTGAEFDNIRIFQKITNDAFGSGYVFGSFLGIEKYISIGTSFSFDFGSYYTYLKHKYFDVKEEGIDFIFNILINFYIF
jgi:hypothetical protein